MSNTCAHAAGDSASDQVNQLTQPNLLPEDGEGSNASENQHDLGCPSDTNESFETAKDAQQFAERYAIERGFVNVQRGGSDSRRLRLRCDKGDSHHAKKNRVRETSSRQSGCPYRLGVHKRVNSRWFITA